jgi:hypothetical protein
VVIGQRRVLGARPQHLDAELARGRDVEVARVVHHHVEQDADAARVRGVDQRAQIVGRAHVAVEQRVVECVVAVVGVVLELLVAADHPAVDLLVRRGDPQRVDAQRIEPADRQPGGQPAQIAAVKRGDVVARRGLARSAVAAIVRRITVGEPVGHHEVHDRIVCEAAGDSHRRRRGRDCRRRGCRPWGTATRDRRDRCEQHRPSQRSQPTLYSELHRCCKDR